MENIYLDNRHGSHYTQPIPRQARLDAPGALHHIMVRRINRAHIFADGADKARFLERLGQNIRPGKCAAYAGASRHRVSGPHGA